MLLAVQQAGGSKSSIIPSNSAFIQHQTEDFQATSKWSCNKIDTDPESVSSRVAAVVTRGLLTLCQTTIITVCSFLSFYMCLGPDWSGESCKTDEKIYHLGGGGW